MNKIVIGLILLGLAIVLFKWLAPSDIASKVSDPATTMIGNDLKFKSQAEMTVRITSMNDAMKGGMALGNLDPLSAKSTLDELDRLHHDMDDAKRRLGILGDTPEEIQAWLQRVHWDDFQRLEDQYRKAAAGN